MIAIAMHVPMVNHWGRLANHIASNIVVGKYPPVLDLYLILLIMAGSGLLNTLIALANSTLIILFLKMLKFSKIISPKSKNIVTDNSEYFGIFLLLKWIFKNKII